MTLPQFIGESGGVWSNEQIFQIPERRFGRQRFFLENVEGRSGDSLFLQRGGKRLFIHKRASAHIDEISIRLHKRKAVGINEPASFTGYRNCEHDPVAFGQE